MASAAATTTVDISESSSRKRSPNYSVDLEVGADPDELFNPFFCLFDLMFTSQSTVFQSYRNGYSLVEQVLSRD